MLRSAYETTMRFPGVGLVPIRWYFVREGTEPLPFPTVYSSHNWANPGDIPDNYPGEVLGAPRTWSSGRVAISDCHTPKGSAAAWRGEATTPIVCVPQPASNLRLNLTLQGIVTFADTMPVMAGGGVGGGMGSWFDGFTSTGGGDGGGTGLFTHDWVGSGGGSGNGEGTFASVLISEGGLLGDGGGDFSAPSDDMPIGAVCWWTNTTPPAGYLVCDGSAVSRSTYAALFAICGTSCGIGNGSTTFNLPDLRGRSPIGSGTGTGLSPRTLGATGGAETHALTLAQNAAHTHAQDLFTVKQTGPSSLTPGVSGPFAYSLGGTTGSSGTGSAHNTMHPFQVLVPIIRYQ